MTCTFIRKCFPQHLINIQNQRPELAGLAYLPDLAQMDWWCDQVYYSPAANAWPNEAFNALTPEQQANSQLLLSPDCRLMTSHWPLSKLWDYHAGRLAQVDMQYLQEPETLLLYRQNYKIRLKQIANDVYQLLIAANQGKTLEQLAEYYPDSISHLPALIANGWVHGFQVKS